MGATYSGKGTVCYRYYICTNAVKRGWATCSSKAVPAAEIERFVLDQLRGMRSGDAELNEHQRHALDALDSLNGAPPTAAQLDQFRSLVERVEYDGAAGTVTMTLRDGEEPVP